MVAIAAAGLAWFVVRVATPRLGSQPQLEGLAAPPGFDSGDPGQIDSLLVSFADRLVERPLNAGLVIGVTRNGRRHVVARGVASREDPARKIDETTLFEVGSLTKTLTGVALAQAVLAGDVELEQPIASLLPATTGLSSVGDSITLRHLATHTAGLPSDPPSVSFLASLSLFEEFPFGRVTDTAAFASLKQITDEMPADAIGTYAYSNFGFMLLGRLLEAGTGRTYAELIEEGLAAPLGMARTWVVPPQPELRRLAVGHRVGNVVEHWYAYQLPGAGGIVSTVPDLLTFAEAHFRPETTPLAKALELAAEDHVRVSDTVTAGLGWRKYAEGDDPPLLYHFGATMGFRSYIGLVPALDLGIVVLGNSRDPTINEIARLLMRTLSATPGSATQPDP